MKQSKAIVHEHFPDPHHGVYSRTLFGFWLYVLSDFILFGSLFAVYAVLHNNTFGGPSASQLFSMEYALSESLVLLLSSFTIGIGNAYAHRKQKGWTITYFLLSFAIGIVFLGMEFHEWAGYLRAGYSWKISGFLSAYYTLVGTHAVHMFFALLWVIVLIIPVFYEGISHVSLRRLTCLKMFWQFLNIIWAFIFTFVYMMGVAT